ncbi:MAG: methionyl-tRNA formyltransferase [Spirochaetales bacterium]|jgi:methionyl-tRNA formyltransferase|nr:methionyl-tRNA formyltransferase [Spirochaetales bacterium]
MRILFAGSPEIALPSLDRISKRFEICAVLTAPDRQAGRGRKLSASPVKGKALELNIPVLQPHKLNAQARELISGYKPDILAVVAFSKIFGPKFLALFPSGAINLHPSLLPKHRGPAPIPSAILSGDYETGVTIQYVGLKMDAGAVLHQEKILIGKEENAAELAARLADLGADMIVETILEIENGTAVPEEQNHSLATYCSLLSREDGRIHWTSTAVEIDRLIRAYNPWPAGFTMYKDLRLSLYKTHVYSGSLDQRLGSPGTVLGVDKAEGILVQTKQGILAVEELQLQSRKRVGWKAFLNGTPDFAGSVLGGD